MDTNRPGPEPARPLVHQPGAKPPNTWVPAPVGRPKLEQTPAADGEAPLQLDNKPLPVAGGGLSGSGKITAFGKGKRHEDCWLRTPNTTGSGAIHVKTFHCKLTEDALAYMDQAINEWLDAHPQYEVKFVSSTIGILTGKLKEPALFCQVWV